MLLELKEKCFTTPNLPQLLRQQAKRRQKVAVEEATVVARSRGRSIDSAAAAA